MTSLARRLTTAAAVILATLAAWSLAAPAATATPAYPTPLPDPFYAAPADIASTAPGDVLAVRRADTWLVPGN